MFSVVRDLRRNEGLGLRLSVAPVLPNVGAATPRV